MKKTPERGYLLEDFRVFHLNGALKERVEPHCHSFHKLFMLKGGSGEYELEGKTYSLKPRDIVLIGRGKLHCPSFKGSSYERIIFYISPDFLSRACKGSSDLGALFSRPKSPVLRFSERLSRELFQQAERIMIEERDGDELSPLLSRSLLIQLLIELARNMNAETSLNPKEVKDKKMLDIIRYIDANFAENITIDLLANEFYLSKFHMMRRFSDETGMSIFSYISLTRLRFARDLMEEGASATEACYKSGFGSYSAFLRAYTRLFKQSPTGRQKKNEYEFLKE